MRVNEHMQAVKVEGKKKKGQKKSADTFYFFSDALLHGNSFTKFLIRFEEFKFNPNTGLRLKNIFRLRLNASTVVVEACQSSRFHHHSFVTITVLWAFLHIYSRANIGLKRWNGLVNFHNKLFSQMESFKNKEKSFNQKKSRQETSSCFLFHRSVSYLFGFVRYLSKFCYHSFNVNDKYFEWFFMFIVLISSSKKPLSVLFVFI